MPWSFELHWSAGYFHDKSSPSPIVHSDKFDQRRDRSTKRPPSSKQRDVQKVPERACTGLRLLKLVFAALCGLFGLCLETYEGDKVQREDSEHLSHMSR